MYPIFIFGCSPDSNFWTKAVTTNSLNIVKIKMVIELYKPGSSGNVDISSFTSNLFTLLGYQSNATEQISDLFPVQITNPKKILQLIMPMIL